MNLRRARANVLARTAPDHRWAAAAGLVALAAAAAPALAAWLAAAR